MELLLLKPTITGNIWGGNRLVEEFGFDAPAGDDPAGEAWVFSCHPKGPSTVMNGRYAGRTLPEALKDEGNAVLGTHNLERGVQILVKLIDAAQPLSVQVHPDDAYAWQDKQQNGKTEAWHIVDARPGATLVYGLNREVTPEELARRAEAGTLEALLNSVEVVPGDTAFIPAGTIHAIGDGILLAEVQQSSDITYRLYDYHRLQKDGTYRELDVKKAVDVAIRKPTAAALEPKLPPVKTAGGAKIPLKTCAHFSMTRLEVSGEFSDAAGPESFVSLVALKGRGAIRAGDQELALGPCSSVFVPASTAYTLRGEMILLETRT